MKRLLFLIGLILVSTQIFAQNNFTTLGADLTGLTVQDLGSNRYKIDGNFLDLTQVYSGNSIVKGDILWSPTLVSGDTCRRFYIDSIYSQFAGFISFRVVDSVNIGSPSSENSKIVRETPNLALGIDFASGNGALNECINRYYQMHLDTVITQTDGVSEVTKINTYTYQHDNGAATQINIDTRDSISTDANNILVAGTDKRPFLDSVDATNVKTTVEIANNSVGEDLQTIIRDLYTGRVTDVQVDSIAETNRVVILLDSLGAEVSRDTFSVGAGGASSDEKIKISANDTDARYLEQKLVGGDNITMDTLNEGGDEQLEINVDVSGLKYQWYDAGNGCRVMADSAGVTFTKNVITGEYTLTIPAGVDVKSGTVNGDFNDGDSNNDLYFIFNYDASESFNQGMSTARIPFVRINNGTGSFNRTSPAFMNNTLQQGVSSLGSGDIELKLVDAVTFFPNHQLVFWIP
jgi:hypothetical protein